jgi:hypothetical protein
VEAWQWPAPAPALAAAGIAANTERLIFDGASLRQLGLTGERKRLELDHLIAVRARREPSTWPIGRLALPRVLDLVDVSEVSIRLELWCWSGWQPLARHLEALAPEGCLPPSHRDRLAKWATP